MEISILNPWWKGKEHIKEDKHIKEYEEKKYKWKPELFEEINFELDNLYILRGPRQVGKTTLIKLMIKKLLERNINEKAIFFLNCDELMDFRELASLLREYLQFASVNNTGEKYIFLDEVSRIKDWQRAIKSMKDSGELEKCFILATGSHSLDLKHGIERLPGRTGKLGKDLILLPMSFSEYISLLNPEIANKIKKSKTFSIEDINKKIDIIRVYDSELKILFSQYLITGGFPLVINEFFSNNKISDYLYELYLRWVVGDIVKWGKQEKILIQLLRSAILKQTSAISWDSLAKESEIKSHKTVSAYVEDLENMFVLLVLYYLDTNKKAPNFDKNKKLYFFDPFIYHVFNKKLYFKENEISSGLIESVVISNLARLNYNDLFHSVYYYKNKREVDVILKIKEEIFPIEVKYQEKISKEDYGGLYHFRKGILVTKKFLSRDAKYPAIPVHLFLAVL